MSSPLQPEFFALLGIDFFLASSLLTCLIDKYFPWQTPYVYQLAALAGFGQLLVSREFIAFFGEYMRFWYSLMYLLVALSNIVAVNIYLGAMKKLLNHAKIFMFTVTVPSICLAAFFLSNYSQIAAHPLVMAPQISGEATFMAVVAFDTFVVGLGTYVFFKPKWRYIALGSGTAIGGAGAYTLLKPSWEAGVFIASAVALAVACVLVLGVSIYILATIWMDTLKQRKIRKEVKRQNENRKNQLQEIN